MIFEHSLPLLLDEEPSFGERQQNDMNALLADFHDELSDPVRMGSCV